jgi:ParB-like chromosome segregation protein Spo0J
MATAAKATQVRAVPLSALRPAEWNPRQISDERFANLCRSIEAGPGVPLAAADPRPGGRHD